MEKLLQDLKYALRTFVKNPKFAALAVVSLGLGIGVNTAVFSVFSAVVLQSSPVADPDKLMQLYTSDRQNPGYLNTSFPNFSDYREQNEVFTGMTAFSMLPLALSSGGEAERLWGAIVTGDYFSVLGVKALRGRVFTADDDKVPGGHSVAIISYNLWQRRFGADNNVIGQEITLNGHVFTVTGITPQGFNGTDLGLSPEVWVPMMMHGEVIPAFDWMNKRQMLWISVIGRLKNGVSLEQAQASMSGLASHLEEAYPDVNAQRGVTLVPLEEAKLTLIMRLTGGTRNNLNLIMTLLLVVSGAVLLICCANVASLLLSRASARRREIAVRLAVGATRGRLIRQLLTESLALALMGGVVGLLLALWTSNIIGALRPPGPVPLGIEIKLSGTVLAFTLLISLLTSVLLGVVPAMASSRPNLVQEMKGQSFPTGRGPLKLALRDFFVIFQVALSLLLVVGAGLFLRSLQHANSINLGFNSERLLVMSFDVRLIGYSPAQGKDFFKNVIERVESLPGIRGASLAESLPLEAGAVRRNIKIEGADQRSDSDERILIHSNIVGPRYFEVMGIPLLHGRDFTAQDNEDAPRVVIINEAMAQRFWPDKEPLGKRISINGAQGPYMEIIGISKNTIVRSIGEAALPYFCLPRLQNYYPQSKLIAQTAMNPLAVLETVRNEVKNIDSRVPVFDAKVFSQHIGESLWAVRVGAGLLSIYGIVALALAIIGVYGVMSYWVSQRTREIGIRIALGAQSSTVIKTVLRKSFTVVAIGMTVGLAGAFLTMRVASNLLYEISPIDMVTYLGTVLILLAVALVASLFAARKAIRIDPLIALKHE